MGHGEFRRLPRQLEGVVQERPGGLTLSPAQALQGRSTGCSRPLHADHADLAALESAQRQAAHARRRPGLPPEPLCADRFVDGEELLKDGTELHLFATCACGPAQGFPTRSW